MKFTACSFGHLALACSTPVFYRRTSESILTVSSIAHKTLNFSLRTNKFAYCVIYWSLSLWSVQFSSWSLSLCNVQCSLWSLSLCNVQCTLWSLSLCNVQCSLWSLSLCNVQCSLWSLSLCTVHCSLWSLSLCYLPPLCSGNDRPQSSYSQPHVKATQQPVTSAISTQCCTQDPSVNANCRQPAAVFTPQVLLSQSKIIAKFSQSQQYFHRYFCRPANIYIMLYNVPL